MVAKQVFIRVLKLLSARENLFHYRNHASDFAADLCELELLDCKDFQSINRLNVRVVTKIPQDFDPSCLMCLYTLLQMSGV